MREDALLQRNRATLAQSPAITGLLVLVILAYLNG